MARLRNSDFAARDDQARVVRDVSYSHQTASPSPSPSQTSDKENEKRQTSKGSMAPPPMPLSNDRSTPVVKRRRLDGALQEQTPGSRSATDDDSQLYYDPNQSIEERRRIRKGLRDLNKEAAELRTEWMAPDSTGLEDAITRANSYFRAVKQTSDATIDSRLLVTAGDLAYRKTQQVSIGEGSQGIDVDEFVSKCISFMRVGDEDDGPTTSTQSRRRRTAVEMEDDTGDIVSDEEDEDHNNGDALNWEYFGAHACFPVNSRPPVPGFLLGPLSVQRRARTQAQRRQRMGRTNPEDAVRPQELQSADLEKQENSNLTHICRNIHDILGETLSEGRKRVEEEGELNEEMSEAEVARLLEDNNLADNGGVPLFKFAINPKSFGQTVENLFYVSFLVKDGKVGVASDSNGMPTLDYAAPPDDARQQPQQRKQRMQRHQAVFSLDFETWQEIVELFNLEESVIPHRAQEELALPTSNGWYS